MFVAILVSTILLVGLGVFAFFYLQVKRNRRPDAERPSLDKAGSLSDCARCGQRRLIVQKEAGLCASCWSALRTKQV
ncbi:MAG TPA: hypothetical protein VE262_10780 [Blastocatellia bacterium]|nr:hypothetical protein [Blastocatellia bacterium]